MEGSTVRLRRVVSGLRDRGLRSRWARQENHRNGKAYEAAHSAWSATNAELQAMVVTACSYTGMGAGQLAPEVGLRRDETLLWTGAGVSLVEAAAWPELRLPGHTALTPELLTESFSAEPSARLTTVDTGSVAVTDQRLVFVGESPLKRRREWAFAELTGMVHTPDAPATLLQRASDSGSGRLTGMLLTPAAVTEFRFVVSLALAEGAGDRAAFVAYLERMLDAHQHVKPAPPPLMTARDAPHVMRLGLRTAKDVCLGSAGGSVAGRALRLVAVAGAAFVLFNVAGLDRPEDQVLSGPPLEVSPAATEPVALPAPDRVLSVPEPAPTTPQPGSQPTAEGRPTPERKVTKSAEPEPKSTSTTSRKPSRDDGPSPRQRNPFPQRDGDDRDEWFCGAPENPYDYNFCGGEYVFSPNPGVCRYFRCAEDFWNDHGYLVVCGDEKVTRTGGYRNSCDGHGGYRQTVYQFFSSWSGWGERAQGPGIWGPPAMDRDHGRRKH